MIAVIAVDVVRPPLKRVILARRGELPPDEAAAILAQQEAYYAAVEAAERVALAAEMFAPSFPPRLRGRHMELYPQRSNRGALALFAEPLPAINGDNRFEFCGLRVARIVCSDGSSWLERGEVRS